MAERGGGPYGEPSTGAPRPGDPAATSLTRDDYRLLVEGLREYAVFLLDPGGSIATWNRGAELVVGYAPPEILGEPFARLFTREDAGRGLPAIELDRAARLERVEAEGWRVRKDGTRFWAHVVITALRDAAGVLRGFGNVTSDLTARRAAELELRESEERFRALVDGVRDYAIYMLDPEGHVRTWNAGAQRLKGYRPEEVLGHGFTMFFPAEDVALGKPARELKVARETGRFEDEGWRTRRDGSRFWAHVIVTALRAPGGELRGFAKVTRDLTLRRAAEDNERALAREQLARAASERARLDDERQRAELERINRAKDEFLATMSHELRTPLNAVLGWATLLRQTPDDAAKVVQGLEVIERNARAQARLVSDLLDMSRIISGKLRLKLQPTDVASLIGDAVDVVRPAADGKGVRLEVELTGDVGVAIADPDRLQQVLWNLLTNAIRFTNPGGRVVVSAARVAEGLRLRVKDTGVGIARGDLPRIFERLRQVDSSTTRAHGGLGLGLAIVRHLVEAHGGSVVAESEGEGQGSTFSIVLPARVADAALHADVRAAATEPATPPPRAVVPLEQPLRGVRALVVEDSFDSLDLLRTVLEMAGAVVTAASGGAEALGATGPFDVLVTDISMPEMDGYELLRRFRSTPGGERVPAVALTAFAHPSDVARSKAAGFQRHLAKPMDTTRVVEEIRAALDEGPRPRSL